MSFIEALKGRIKDQLNVPPLPPEKTNPYLSARRTWNDHVGNVVATRQTWQVVAIAALLIAVAAVGGIIQIGSQSKFIPYVVEVDKHGQSIATGPATATIKADPRVIHATVAEFITDARMVTLDVALQTKAVYRLYAKLSPNDPGTAKMNEWLNGTATSTPFARAATEMVGIEIKSVLAQSPETWQVDWLETIRDRQGVMKRPPVAMRALVGIRIVEPTTSTSEQQIRNNPLGIYVRDFSWAAIP